MATEEPTVGRLGSGGKCIGARWVGMVLKDGGNRWRGSAVDCGRRRGVGVPRGQQYTDTSRRIQGEGAGRRELWLGGFSGDRVSRGFVWYRQARGRGNQVGHGRLWFRKKRSRRIDQGTDQVGRRERSRLEGFVVIEHPAREQGFRRFLHPLIHQCGDLLPQVGRVIESCELETLQ